MKKMKIYLSILAAAATFQSASAQDIQLNILTLDDSIAVGQTTNILVDVCNVDASPVTAPADKIRTLISTSSVVTITGVSDVNGNPLTGWTILNLGAGNGNSVRMEYDLPLANADCVSYHVNLMATGAFVGSGNFTGTIQWNGAPAAGDDPSNNNSTTGVFVTAVPLPVSLTAFTAIKKGSTSLLNWNTATEANNLGFDIERSADSRSFSKIGMVYSKAANGNSHESLNYDYTDVAPMTGINYYRLRQVDRDGKSVYSKIEQVTFGAGTGIRIYPNPATRTVNVEAPEGSQVVVYNIIGQRIEVPVTGSGTVRVLNVSGLSSGNYTIQVLDHVSGMSSHKLAVVK
jgi:hypothetical protein